MVLTRSHDSRRGLISGAALRLFSCGRCPRVFRRTISIGDQSQFILLAESAESAFDDFDLMLGVNQRENGEDDGGRRQCNAHSPKSVGQPAVEMRLQYRALANHQPDDDGQATETKPTMSGIKANCHSVNVFPDAGFTTLQSHGSVSPRIPEREGRGFAVAFFA